MPSSNADSSACEFTKAKAIPASRLNACAALDVPVVVSMVASQLASAGAAKWMS
jgi:hypothetical protein